MTVILLSGKAEAGKTTAAKYIEEKLNLAEKTVAIIPYGQYVKDTAKIIFHWNGKKDQLGRSLLQRWGTDIVRSKDNDFWVTTVTRLAYVSQDILDYIIIDDCRFSNEIDCWRGRVDNYVTIRVERPGWENSLTPEQRQHPSETALDGWDFDYTVSATDKEHLYKKLNPIIRKLKKLA